MKGAAIALFEFPSTIHVHVHMLPDPAVTQQLAAILAALSAVATNQGIEMADLTALTAAVTKDTDVQSSAITLLNGLSAQIAALKTDPVALQALADQLNSKADELGAAVAANTPAAP